MNLRNGEEQADNDSISFTFKKEQMSLTTA